MNTIGGKLRRFSVARFNTVLVRCYPETIRDGGRKFGKWFLESFISLFKRDQLRVGGDGEASAVLLRSNLFPWGQGLLKDITNGG